MQQLKCLKYKVSSDVNAAIPNKIISDLVCVCVHVFHTRADIMLPEFREKPGRCCTWHHHYAHHHCLRMHLLETQADRRFSWDILTMLLQSVQCSPNPFSLLALIIPVIIVKQSQKVDSAKDKKEPKIFSVQIVKMAVERFQICRRDKDNKPYDIQTNEKKNA